MAVDLRRIGSRESAIKGVLDRQLQRRSRKGVSSKKGEQQKRCQQAEKVSGTVYGQYVQCKA